MEWLNRILVPVDGSQCSAAALHYATFLSQHYGAVLDILRVIPREKSHMSLWNREKMSAEYQARLGRLLGNLPKHILPNIRTRVLTGDPAQVICDVARAEGHDLIVMGYYGETGPQGTAAGHVTNAVMAALNCRVVPIWESTDPSHQLYSLTPLGSQQPTKNISSDGKRLNGTVGAVYSA